MAAGDFKTIGTGTINASNPGENATVQISDGSVASSDQVYIQPTSVPGSDTRFEKPLLAVTNVGSGTFTVMSNEQLPENVTFNYIVFATA